MTLSGHSASPPLNAQADAKAWPLFGCARHADRTWIFACVRSAIAGLIDKMVIGTFRPVGAAPVAQDQATRHEGEGGDQPDHALVKEPC